MQDRLKASLEDELEIRKYQRGAIQIRLAKMEADDNVEDLRGHLGQMTGIATGELEIMPESIPTISTTVPANSGEKFPDTPGTAAAVLNDKAKEERARGDAKYTWRPQVGIPGQATDGSAPLMTCRSFITCTETTMQRHSESRFNFQSLTRSENNPRSNSASWMRLIPLIDLDTLRSDEMANRLTSWRVRFRNCKPKRSSQISTTRLPRMRRRP